MEGLLALLIWVIVVGLVFYVLFWAVGEIGLPDPFGKIAKVILVVAVVIVALYLLMGIAPSFPKLK